MEKHFINIQIFQMSINSKNKLKPFENRVTSSNCQYKYLIQFQISDFLFRITTKKQN